MILRGHTAIPTLFRLAAALLALAVLAPGGAQARDVEAGAFVTSISKIESDEGSFRIAFYVWFNDPAGEFDIGRDLEVIAREVVIDEIGTEPRPQGGTYTFARIKALVDQPMDFRNYPFDRQILRLRMEGAVDSSELRFTPDVVDTGLSDDIVLLGWTVGEATMAVSERTYDTGWGYWAGRDDSFSQLVLAVEVTRHRSVVLIDDFLGFTFAFLLTSLSYLVSCTELGLRVGMTTGSLFAAVINLYRLDDAAGFKPGLGLVDRLAFLIFGAIIVSLLIAIAAHRISKTDSERADRLDTRLGGAVMAMFLAAIVWTVHSAMA